MMVGWGEDCSSSDWPLQPEMRYFGFVTTPEIELSDGRKFSQEMRITFNFRIKAGKTVN